ncbi:MAG: homocitrate synthase [Deltaproteobacteria bacterium]|nr:homocitrate synthase [Deltaproteobacteria bacterium]
MGIETKTGRVIYFIDVTNRDGVQTSRLGLAKLQKTMINLYLDKIGIFQSEFGFPVTSHEKNYLNANMELVKKGIINTIRLSGWMRALTSDVYESFDNIPNLKHINISISTSDQMIIGKFGGKKTREDILVQTLEAIDAAKARGAETIGVNAEDASRTDEDFLIEFTKAIKKQGAARLRYCDTIGYDDPDTAYKRLNRLAKEVKLPLEIHFHNDVGLAVGNSVMGAKGAIDGGVDAYINTTVNGMGERAGNADFASCLLAILKTSGFKNKYKINKKLKLDKIWQIAKYAAYAFGVPIAINQPAVGGNAFAHESGIHADGALKDKKNYELYAYEALGRGEPEEIETGSQITLGEYSGIKGFRNVYEKLEMEFKNEKEARQILELVRYANIHTQKPLMDNELRFIYKHPDIAAKIMTIKP